MNIEDIIDELINERVAPIERALQVFVKERAMSVFCGFCNCEHEIRYEINYINSQALVGFVSHTASFGTTQVYGNSFEEVRDQFRIFLPKGEDK